MIKMYRCFFTLCILFAVQNEAFAQGTAKEIAANDQGFELVLREEILINSSPQNIWSSILRRESWMDFSLDYISGNSNEEGELIRVTQKNPESIPRQYFVKTVKVVPPSQIVNKVFPIDGNSFLGFTDTSLTVYGAKTKLTYDFYMHITMSQGSGYTAQEIESMNEDSRVKIRAAIQTIKELSETVPTQ